MRFVLDTANAVYSAVGAVSAQLTMVAGKKYLFTTSTACLIAQGANPTASAGNGSTVVNPGDQFVVDPAVAVKLAVIQCAAGGHCTLTPIAVAVR